MKKFDEFENFDSEDMDDVFSRDDPDDYVYEDGEFIKREEVASSKLEVEKKGENMKHEKVQKTKKNYRLSKDVLRVVGLTISGVLVVLSLLTMAKSFTPAKKIDNLILSYNVVNSADYRVNLLKNDFYETSSLGKGELVPVTFIDNIEIDFKGNLSASKIINANYSYQITGEIVATATDNGKEGSAGRIWSKNYVFVPTKTQVTSGTGYSIQDKVIIDYSIYNDLVNQYKLLASVPMDAVLYVKMSVVTDGNADSQVLNDESSVVVKIPLSVSTVMISSDEGEPKTKTLVDTQEIPASNNYVLLAISIVILLGALVATIKLLKGLRKMTEEHSVLLKFNRIMRDFNQVIIEIDELPEVKDAAIIEVKNFKDMLDIEKELHLPIMCTKSKNGILTETVFYIVNQSQVFKYRLNSEPERF